MNIKFILNGEDVAVHCEANIRLIDILREKFGLLGAKANCLNGQCGLCSVFFNGYVSPACLIPAFRVRDSEIVTIEGFSQTLEYQDILAGFAGANMTNCSFCEAGKILSVEAILKKPAPPSKEEILGGFNGIMCRCTSSNAIIEAVNITANIRQRRLYGRYT